MSTNGRILLQVGVVAILLASCARAQLTHADTFVDGIDITGCGSQAYSGTATPQAGQRPAATPTAALLFLIEGKYFVQSPPHGQSSPTQASSPFPLTAPFPAGTVPTHGYHQVRIGSSVMFFHDDHGHADWEVVTLPTGSGGWWITNVQRCSWHPPSRR